MTGMTQTLFAKRVRTPKNLEKIFYLCFRPPFSKGGGVRGETLHTAFLFDNFFFAPVAPKKKWKTISAVEDGVRITQTLFAKRVRTPKKL